MLDFIFLQAATAAAEGPAQQSSWSFWASLVLGQCLFQ